MKRWHCILLVCLAIGPTQAYGRDKVSLDSCDFSWIFHKVGAEVSTTTLREEQKVVVKEDVAEHFIANVEKFLGDDKVADVKNKRLKFREQPENQDEVFVTQTDYLRVFKGVDKADKKEINKAYIRMRRYMVVPKGTATKDLKGLKNPKVQKLADQEGDFVKLEFKVGHPDEETGRDMEGVVDKPGITIDRKDVDALFSGIENYRKIKDEVVTRVKALTLTTNRGPRLVNKPDAVDALIERIGFIHQAGISPKALAPHHETSYQRQARVIEFRHPPQMIEQGLSGTFEVQITIDKDILVTEYGTNLELPFKPEDRVVELKIPVAYANVPDGELRAMGLGELADVRAAYLALNPQPGTQRGVGKTRNAPLRQAIPLPP